MITFPVDALLPALIIAAIVGWKLRADRTWLQRRWGQVVGWLFVACVFLYGATLNFNRIPFTIESPFLHVGILMSVRTIVIGLLCGYAFHRILRGKQQKK